MKQPNKLYILTIKPNILQYTQQNKTKQTLNKTIRRGQWLTGTCPKCATYNGDCRACTLNADCGWCDASATCVADGDASVRLLFVCLFVVCLFLVWFVFVRVVVVDDDRGGVVRCRCCENVSL
jgi:uncharacterized protein (DUF983 family)